MKRNIIPIIVISVIFICSYAFSEIRVSSVRGSVLYKTGRDWKPLRRGMKLREGTKISTGARSAAVIQIDNHRLTVRQLTMMKISRNRVTKKSSNTRIGLKYGRLNARVKRIKTLKTSFKVMTPVATSSVRGTEEEIFYGSKTGMRVWVLDGAVELGNPFIASRFIRGHSPSRAVFQLKTGAIKPMNLLSVVRNASFVRIYSNNITDDEKSFHEIAGDELFDNSDGAIEFLDLFLRGGASIVTIEVIWP